MSRCLGFALENLRQVVLGFRQARALKKSTSLAIGYGLPILSQPPEELTRPLLHRVHSAIELAARNARAARRLRNYVRFVLIREGKVSGFLKASRTIVLSHELLMHASTEEIASVIVHETVHARINAFGVGTWSSRLPEIESRCLREQMEFLEHLPGTEHIIQHLQQYVGTVW